MKSTTGDGRRQLQARVSGSKHVGADIAQPRIDDDRGHGRALTEPLWHLQRRDNVGTSRSPGENGFVAREPPRQRLGVLGGHRDDFGHLISPPERRDKANSDPFYLVRAGVAPRPAPTSLRPEDDSPP